MVGGEGQYRMGAAGVGDNANLFVGDEFQQVGDLLDTPGQPAGGDIGGGHGLGDIQCNHQGGGILGQGRGLLAPTRSCHDQRQ